jgi:hypothetical protein
MTIQTYINHPEIERKIALAAIKFLNGPKLTVEIKELRFIYKEFEKTKNAKNLIDRISEMMKDGGAAEKDAADPSLSRINLSREDLHLICFDFVS